MMDGNNQGGNVPMPGQLITLFIVILTNSLGLWPHPLSQACIIYTSLISSLLGYAYIGYGGPNSHMSRGSDFNGSQDYLAEQFQNMSVGPRHMYPMVPMAMDHPMSYSGPNQYGMPMQYPSSHPPSPPSNVTVSHNRPI